MKRKSAGLAIVYNNKLLLTHPTGSKWWYTYSIPKGGLEEGETYLDAAIRETREEIGLKINKNLINKKRYEYETKNKTVSYFIVKIDSLSDIGLREEKIKKSKLQIEEVDWAGFVSIRESRKRLTNSQLSIINNLISLKYLKESYVLDFNSYILER